MAKPRWLTLNQCIIHTTISALQTYNVHNSCSVSLQNFKCVRDCSVGFPDTEHLECHRYILVPPLVADNLHDGPVSGNFSFAVKWFHL